MRVIHTLQIPPILLCITGGLMWLVHQFTSVIHIHTGYEYIVSRLLLLIALVLFGAIIYQFWKNSTTASPLHIDATTSLIQSGPFRWSRNPIYIVDVIVLLAWLIWMAEWANLIFIGVFIYLVQTGQIHREEQSLKKQFGSEYETYCQRVSRWI